MKKIKKLPFILAFAVAVIIGACSDIEVTPRGTGDDQDPIIIIPPKPRGSTVVMDTVTLS